MTQYGFVIDADACANCKACVIACKDVNDMPAGYKLRKTLTGEAGTWEEANGVFVPRNVFSYSISLACNHCMNPACVEACPSGAMQKDPETGVVWSDHGVCIACGSCQKACPYDAPVVVDAKGYALKCDFCKDRLASGEAPACVGACMNRCLNFGELSELRESFGDNAEDALVPSSATGPSLVILPHRGLGSSQGDIRLSSMEEEIVNG